MTRCYFKCIWHSYFFNLIFELCWLHVKFGYEQEKELIERHNTWLNDELTSKVDSLIELRRKHADLEADLSSKLADVSLLWHVLPLGSSLKFA